MESNIPSHDPPAFDAGLSLIADSVPVEVVIFHAAYHGGKIVDIVEIG